MKSASAVFKSIRFAKGEPRGKPHSSTDDEEHGAVGEKEFNQQVKHVKKMAMQEEPDSEQYKQEIETAMAKSTGKIRNDKNIAKGSSQSVVAEAVKDEYDVGEYDQEGDMAKSDLRSIMANAQKVHDMLDDADNLPEWVQSKITLAEDYMSTVANYMTAEMNEAVKKPNATTRHLRQYPVSDKDVAKPVKKPEKKKPEQGVAEETEYLEEKNAPTNPALWSRAKALARSKFDVYPSAYANGWAAKWYKSKGGGWKSVSEAKENPPFDPPYKTVKKVVDKSGAVHGPMSRAKHLAKTAAEKQKTKKPMQESRQTEIVREAANKAKLKTKTVSKEKYEAEPELGVKRSDTNTMM